ncbi:NmrA-like family protein-like protein [Byssothecium circinans]|uniref:NmrA-like family protein-like protein n=1 Tax=Byssothecium circinans TaxID=147558 RepID=A0A6A5U5T1_9PLEO|nr:NmrA-like family protein-like protein [Byssothecium circinans]
MVKIAAAGGTGNVATEVLRVSAASGKHDITIFTRSKPSTNPLNLPYKIVDYQDRAALTEALKGFDVCLSFLVVHLDKDNVAHKNLTHASIAAGVKRFAPSEWAVKNGNGANTVYANKDIMATYLSTLPETQSGKLEYCHFQPSIFMDYFAHPNPLTPGLLTWPFFADFENRRALVVDSGDDPLVVTALSDISNVFALALEDTRPWPAVGGMRGARTTMNEVLALGKKIRGGEWHVDYVKSADTEKGVLTSDFVPELPHPAFPVDQRKAMSTAIACSLLTAISTGGWDVSDEWNQRFPEYKFIGLEEYLRKAWEGKP